MENNILQEFAQVSIVRYNAMIEHNHLLEMRIGELERYIESLEKLIIEASREYPSHRFFSLDREAVNKVMQLEGESDEV